jgi:hypothetical protein
MIMPTPPFNSLDALQDFLTQSSLLQFQEALPFFSLTELAESFTLLQSQPVLEAQGKLEYLFKFVDKPSSLEMLGKTFSPFLFIGYLNFLPNQMQCHNSLNSILIGLSPSVFSSALHHLQGDHIRLLQQEGLGEPLQYQLTQFIHEGENLKKSIEKDVQQFKQDPFFITPEELNQQILQSLIHRIDNLRNLLIDYLERASTALAIVWHTDRIDLIEKLSSVNESIQHLLIQYIGHPTFDNLAPTGLYIFLEQTLANIFDSTLKDDDAAIEGLARLSIWHVNDYSEIGLLPSTHFLEQESINLLQHSKIQSWNHQQLHSIIQSQLDRLGIGKVRDLKKFHIFSKSLLKTYIDQHQHFLT